MSEQDSQPGSFPVERFPGPVCSYVFRDGSPVICSLSPVFESQFGTVQQGVTLSNAFDSLNIDIQNDGDLVTILENSDQLVTVRRGTGTTSVSDRYLVQNVPPSDDEAGFLVFVDSSDTDLGDTDDTLDGDHIATIISHDLRNPLDVAKSRLRAAKELDEDEHFEHVEWAHQRMERIVDDVLTLARVGQTPDSQGTVDLDSLVRTAWKTVETDRATLTVVDDLPRVSADSDRVLRLFENLFRNSVEHGSTSNRAASEHDDSNQDADEMRADPETNSQPSVTVTVGPLESRQKNGFYVADDGSGIPPEERNAVFDPGYSCEGNGTGLGLSIVSRIVDAHGWSIDLTGGTDGGVRFEVTGLQSPDNS